MQCIGSGLSFKSIQTGPWSVVTPPKQAVFLSTTHPFKPPPVAAAPLDWSEKVEPWHALLAVYVVVWCRPRTLPPVKVL